MTLQLDQRVRPTADVLISDLGDEIVLLELSSEQYFGLDGVGAAMWRRLCSAPTIRAALDALESEFQVDRTTLESDLDRLLGEMLQQRLLEVAHEASA